MRTRIRASRAVERWSTYQTSSSMRSCHGSAARPFTCAQPVMPGADLETAALALGVLVDLSLDGRPRADERHLTAHDVDEVGQLVERETPEQAADAGDPRIALFDHDARADRLGAGDHRPQLEHLEGEPVAADAALAEERGPAALEPDGQSRGAEHRGGDHEGQRGQGTVEERVHRVSSSRSQEVGVPSRR